MGSVSLMHTAMAAMSFRSVLVIIFLQVAVKITSQQSLTSCQECERRPTSCRRLAGLYTVTVLTKGTYNPVVEIPAQACSINITELAPSQNYLAVRTDRGEYVVNGHWSVGSTGTFRGVGTRFNYNRRTQNCPGECVYADGPTTRQIVVQLLYYSKNPGIAYEFVLPTDVPFKPFDNPAPQLEARTRTQRQRGTQSLRRQNANRGAETYQASGREAAPYQAGSRGGAETYQSGSRGAETYQSGTRGGAETYQRGSASVEEPRRSSAGQRGRVAAGSAGRYPTVTQDQRGYGGASYGSHTLGGRGQSYQVQYTGDSSQNTRPGFSSSTSRRRPTFAPRPVVQRQQPPSWRSQLSASSSSYYGSSHHPDSGRGHQTLASSSRGGLVDRTYSRSLDPDNRLQTFERPAVGQRPALTIGTGASGSDYEWTISGFTDCSLTCGGGVQETKVVCVLTSAGTQVVVTEDNCQNAVKPRIQRVSCNNEPCPPGWVTDEWSECSVTCGSGTQNRRIECRQRFSDTLELSVSASQCDQTQKPAVAQQCETDPCAQWRHGEWGECSEECGSGEKQRKVECVDGSGVQIPENYCPAPKPAETETCNTQACNTHWLFTAWSDQCSADCGSGVTTRSVVCTDRAGRPVAENACDSDKRPKDRRRCESSVSCGSAWFTGPWSQCSHNCGEGVKTRQVVCVQRAEGREGLSVAEDSRCQSDDKPALEEACFSTACGAQYYMTAWSQCSVTCGSGVRTREVRCLDEAQRQSWSCDRSHAPKDREACQLSQCRHEEPRDTAPQTSRTDGNCVDKFWNCRLVVQARLCKLPYYHGDACCATCRRARHHHHHRRSKPSH